jgi:hypothetical protein
MKSFLFEGSIAGVRQENSGQGARRARRLASCICATLAELMAGLAIGQSSINDSASGVDTVLGNALNPGRPSAPIPQDPAASWSRRSPSGWLYPIPFALPEERRSTEDGWEYSGWAEFGTLGGDANSTATLFRMYKDLRNGFYFNNFGFQLEKPGTALYVESEGGGVGRLDQFYGLRFGRYNDWKLKLFYNETPHVYTTAYRSLWDGVGTDNLTLAPTTPALVAGGGNAPAQAVSGDIRTALATIPESQLQVVRKKAGIEYDITLSDAWRAYASYTHERREGARPFGAVWGGFDGGGNVEIPESIDYTTHEATAGVSYRDLQQSLNIRVSASLFRNNIDTMTFQNPLSAAISGTAGLSPGIFTAGRYDLVPDNDYFQLRGEYARSFPDFYQSRFTAVASVSASRQNDRLIAPTLFALTGGTNLATGAPLANNWNTTDALSRPNADLKTDTALIDVGWTSRPLEPLSVTGKVRYYQARDESSYWSCNPLTGEWGRIINEGSGSVVVGANPVPANNPAGTSPGVYNTVGCNLAAARALGIVPDSGDAPIARIPLNYRQMNYKLTGDYQIDKASSLIGTYERETIDRDPRERERMWEDKYTLAYTNRGFEQATLRASYEYSRRSGSEYIVDPYQAYSSASLGPLPTANLTNVASWIRNISSFRMFDLADRTSNVLNAMFNTALLPDLDAGLSAQWNDADYPNSQYGRVGHARRGSISLELNYRPSAALNVYGFYSYQVGSMNQRGIQQGFCLIGTAGVTAANFLSQCPEAGSSLYPLDNAWSVDSDDRNQVAGLGLRYDFTRALADVNYTYSFGRSKISYQYGPGISLGLTPTQIALAGNGFSDLTFLQNVLEASLLVPINKTVAARFYYRFENGKVNDWHYAGVAQNPVPATNAVYLDSGLQDYRVNVFGLFLRITL